ncbi:MAG TPA: hypothetical protein VEB40_16350 [Flavipsychrobacter sp.]|nr:hypothetical protein [Flavipsychrobacter sp.]
MMRLIFFLLICAVLNSQIVLAEPEDKNSLPPAKSEKELVMRIVNSLKVKDSVLHASQFMKFDDLWKLVVNFKDTNIAASMQVAQLRQVPNTVRKFDPFFNPQIGLDFNYVVEKGEDSSIHWDRVTLARYELKKMDLTQDMVGYNHISPLRFKGFIFLRDGFNRKTYGVAVTDIQNIQGKWYGGRVVDIFEASDEDEYRKKMAGEIAWLNELIEQGIDIDSMKRAIDSLKNADPENGDDDGEVSTRREVVARKYYFGLLDDEKPVTMYVQYLRGGCPERVCEWIAIFKFDEEGEYFKMRVHKENGKWYFTQEPEESVMELEMKGKTFEGSWLSVKDRIEYEVYMEEVSPKPSTVHKLDMTIDDLWYGDQH